MTPIPATAFLNTQYLQNIDFYPNIAKQCMPEYIDLPNGFVFCSDRNNVHSVCDWECEQGYHMKGEPRATCSKFVLFTSCTFNDSRTLILSCYDVRNADIQST